VVRSVEPVARQSKQCTHFLQQPLVGSGLSEVAWVAEMRGISSRQELVLCCLFLELL
jgi:hypothetical protein